MAKANKAKMPPSPRLSARITNKTYFRVTTKMMDQKISDKIPRILLGLTNKPYSGLKHSRNVYKGLVPTSP